MTTRRTWGWSKPLTPADFGEPTDARWATVEIAGLQFYNYYAAEDEVADEADIAIPKAGEQAQLIRRPDNPHDPHAVEVWIRSGRLQLGHLPRHIAAKMAPALDGGAMFRAYVAEPGDGSPWSATVAIFGDDLPDGIAPDPDWDL